MAKTVKMDRPFRFLLWS